MIVNNVYRNIDRHHLIWQHCCLTICNILVEFDKIWLTIWWWDDQACLFLIHDNIWILWVKNRTVMRKIFDLLPLTIEISASNHQLYYCPGQVYTFLLPFNLANLFMQPNRKSTLAKIWWVILWPVTKSALSMIIPNLHLLQIS